MFAYQIQAYIKAGLKLVGYDKEYREYVWVGTDDRWGRAEHAMMIFEHQAELARSPF